MKYSIAIRTKFGTISAESNDPHELPNALAELRQLSKDLEQAAGKRQAMRIRAPASSKKRKGNAETSMILGALQERVLPTRFFQRARTTGETKQELQKITRSDYTSRKVSQALGILRNKGVLERRGRRNSYVYRLA